MSAIPGARADESDLHQALEACTRQQPATGDAAKDVAREGIAELCPELTSALEASGLAAQLGDGWQRRLKPAQLPDVEWLLRHYQHEPAASGPDPVALAPILDSLHTSSKPTRSWWDRLLAWLQRLIAGQPTAAPHWLQRLLVALKHTPRWVAKVFFYGGIAIIASLLIVVIWRELRIAWAESRRARSRGHRPAGGEGTAASPMTLAQIDAAPLRERPMLLLRMLIQALVTNGRLQGATALTHSELVQRALFTDADQRQRFARVAHLAEARRYAGDSLFERQHAGSEVEHLLADGRALYSQLMSGNPTVAS